MSAERYRDILVSSDPVKQLAAAYQMSVAEVESLKLPSLPADYIEWTFLARVISRFAVSRRDGSEACLHLLLDLVETLAQSTCPSKFPRTKIEANGTVSFTISISTLDLDELNVLVDFIRAQTQGGADSNAVAKVLTALELIWHLPMPDADRDWLAVDPQRSIQQLLTTG